MNASHHQAGPNAFTRAMLYAVYAGVYLLVLFGPIYFGAWLYHVYGAALDWADNCGMGSGLVGAVLLFRYARLDRVWRGALLAALGAGTIAALLSANMIAVAAVLWAMDPAILPGLGGFALAFLTTMILTAPAITGTNRLIEWRLGSDLSWKEWFRNTRFRKPTLLGLGLGLAAFFAAQLAGISFESWLVEVYPAAQAFRIGGFGAGFAIVLTCVLTGPSDARSALRSLIAAVVVFETAVAAEVTTALLVVTLQSNSLRLATADVWLVAPVFIGAVLLVGHKTDGRQSGELDVGTDKEAPA